MEAIGTKTDVLGQYAMVSVDRRLYSDNAIFKAAYWFTEKFYVYLDAVSGDQIAIELRPKLPAGAVDLEIACKDFCNAIVDARVREIVLSETGAIREALITKAFTEGAVTPGLADAQSNEQFLASTPRR